MKNFNLNAKKLQTLSGLFSYPEKWPDTTDLKKIIPEKGGGFEKQFGELQSLQGQYVFLFVNALPEVPCPPYGSFYLEGALMGESTVRLKNLYLEYGFETNEMADHLAVELEFLSFLTTLSTHEMVQKDYDFLLEHLREWTPHFFDRVEENDGIGFYRHVSRYAGSQINACKAKTI